MPKRPIVKNAVFVPAPDAPTLLVRPSRLDAAKAPDEPGPELSPTDAATIDAALAAAIEAGVSADVIAQAIAATHANADEEPEPMPGEEQLPEQLRVSLRSERVSLARARRDVESGDRRRLLGQLVTEAGRAPATVWADDGATRGKPYLERMTLAELRGHVASEIAAVPPGARGRAPRPPVPGSGVELTEREAAICAELGADPKDFVAMRERFASTTTGAQR